MPDDYVSDERAAELARELVDEIEAELLQRPATFEDLEQLRLAHATQTRIEDRQRRDRASLERQREHAAARDEAMARAQLWRDWQDVQHMRRSELSPRAKSHIIGKYGLANYYRLPE